MGLPLTSSYDSWTRTVMYRARADCLLQFPNSIGFVKRGELNCEGVEEILNTFGKYIKDSKLDWIKN